jgi:tetratricopeptide (TPR) repeat protein
MAAAALTAAAGGQEQPSAAELNRRGALLLEKGDYAGALKEFQAAARLRPDDAAIQFNVGLALFRLGRYPEALKPLARALKHPESAAQARYLRGVIFFERRDFASCAKELESLRGNARYGEHVLYMLVESYRNLNDARRSQEAFAELNARYPNSALVHKLLGIAHEWQGNETKAIEEFERALRINPRMPEMAFAIGFLYFKQQRYAEARRWLERELELDPCSAKTHHYLGEIDYLEERLAEAAARYEKAIACDRNFAEPYIGLGTVHERRGDIETAVKLYREAVKRNPESAQARFKLGTALRKSGRREEGDQELAVARRLYAEEAKAKPRTGGAPAGQGR